MKSRDLNASSRKTKKLIKQAFAELLSEKKELANITVKELVTKIEITRATFYNHYDSIYDVAQDIQNETLAVLVNNIDNIETINDFNNYLDDIIEYLKKNEKIYSMILNSDEPLVFADHINYLINKSIYKFLKFEPTKEQFLKLTFYVDGCTNLVIKYFKEEIPYTLDEIKEFFKDMFKILFYN